MWMSNIRALMHKHKQVLYMYIYMWSSWSTGWWWNFHMFPLWILFALSPFYLENSTLPCLYIYMYIYIYLYMHLGISRYVYGFQVFQQTFAKLHNEPQRVATRFWVFMKTGELFFCWPPGRCISCKAVFAIGKGVFQKSRAGFAGTDVSNWKRPCIFERPGILQPNLS